MKYICQVCGYVYDGGKEAVPFDSLPESWKCPLCGAPKGEFRSAEAAPKAETAAPAALEGDLGPFTAGQLAALCSSLGRGCEKQYKAEEAALFRELAAWFTAAAPPAKAVSTEDLAEALRADVAAYPALRAAADAAHDRGAARICVWGEKVTRMLSSLLDRYLREGEAMLEGQEVWVCAACGFIWIGEAPPELCPVCKVPAWKFEKAEGGVRA